MLIRKNLFDYELFQYTYVHLTYHTTAYMHMIEHQSSIYLLKPRAGLPNEKDRDACRKI